MEDGWIKIYQTQNAYHAELVRQAIEKEDISCVVMNKQDSSFFFGNIEIYVKIEDLEKANKIIQNFEP
ncbi:MAG: DUF2007 domain-containing protein [Bacteroidales bacterium]|nr:DUF2007 domain-containing protein [Bacteroidales bacterium]